MRFSQLVDESRIRSDLPGADKRSVLVHLAVCLSEALVAIGFEKPGVDATEILRLLLEREAIGATGIGGGIAVPHGRVIGLERSIGVLCRSVAGVAFGSPDNLPVRLLVGLLTPYEDNAAHLEALSAVSRFFVRGTACGDLLAAPDSRAMVQVIFSLERQP
ncbi:MAG: PTS sugar transporter subunit IIA [Nitrospirae bacterium]|nr:PTS sugar transporter subunit IIA [Magnetococcales bacterium]HAT50108.1 transcriptional regulator [Alphaproteobacteria bacterium]